MPFKDVIQVLWVLTSIPLEKKRRALGICKPLAYYNTKKVLGYLQLGYQDIDRNGTWQTPDHCTRFHTRTGDRLLLSPCVIYSQILRSKTFNYAINGFLARSETMDKAVHKAVSRCLHPNMLYHWHCPKLVGHPDETRMYYSMRCEYYWPLMENEVYSIVRDCCKCVRKDPSKK